MKKTLKKIFAAAMTMTILSANVLPVSAEESQVSYDLKNPEYIEYVSGRTRIEYEEKYIEALYDFFYKEYSNGGYEELVHIYRMGDNSVELHFEFENSNGVRRFMRGWIDGIKLVGTPITQAELDKLAAENNLEYLNPQVTDTGMKATYQSIDDRFKFYSFVLNNIEGYRLSAPLSLELYPSFSDVYGDVNIDGNFDVRDAAEMAERLANHVEQRKEGDLFSDGSLYYRVYHLTINGDYNKDGLLNIRDAAAMAKSLAEK